jgi:RNA polymerase sigma-70 factor (ECF subfamily)
MSYHSETIGMDFSHVYAAYKDKIYSYIFYRVGNNTDVAEDIVSDVFLKAYKNFDSYNEQYAVSTWLYTIAKNTLIDHYRKNKDTVNIDDLEIGDTTDPLYVLIDRDISLSEVEQAIADLPTKQREYITRQFFQGQTAASIAEAENVSPESVRKQVSRGIAALRDALLTFAISVVTLSTFI